MSLRVIIDDSLEGGEIKKALECTEIQNKLNNSFNIRWGNWLDRDSEKFIFNNSQSIKNSIDKEIVILTLRKNHISCPKRIKPGRKTDFPIIGRKYEHFSGIDIEVIDSFNEYKKSNSDYFLEYLSFDKEYRVHVMNLEVFFIEEKYLKNSNELNINDDKDMLNIRTGAFGWELREIDSEALDINVKKNIYDLAIKSVHALGLDFGVVSIGQTSKNDCYVLDVDSTCKEMSSECKNKYISQFTKMLFNYEDLINDTKDITIGADPECLLKDKNTEELVFASDFFTKEGMFGLDNRSIESGKKYYPLLEIRPNYSTNPIDVVNSIESNLNNICKRVHYKNIGLYAGSMPIYNYWVGGHIHFGIRPNSKLIKALDNYLALLIIMIENSYSSKKRKTRYGCLGNFRLKNHGGFEYCTLSSWLVSREICEGILCLAKVIVQEYLNLNENFLGSYSDIRAFYLVNKFYFKDRIKNVINSISNTNTYKKYKSYIDPLFKEILLCRTWDEDKDIRENWNIKFSEEVYRISSKCFIPKNKRRELSISLDDVITIMAGKNKYEVYIYPKDDFSLEKNGYVSFSHDICNKIGIKENDNMSLYYNSNENVFKVGPILGVFSDIENSELGPFGRQSSYFKKIIKFSKDKGMLAYVFTIHGVRWEKQLVKGYAYDFDINCWKEAYFPLPDVIYDRGDVINAENYGQLALDYEYYTKKNNIKFINSLDFINLANDKWKTYLLLNSNDITKEYQPTTVEYTGYEQLKTFLNEYGHIFLKLKKGCRSKGIFSIEKTNDSYEIIHKDMNANVNKFQVDNLNLMQIFHDEIKKVDSIEEEYIIQKAIHLAKYENQSFEIRVVMQKNSNGIWFRTCMAARVAAKGEKFVNPTNEIDKKSSELLLAVFGDKSKLVMTKLRNASKDITTVIDSTSIQVGELAIDFGIDNELNVFVIEVNSKPDNLLSTISAYRMRNLSIYRILEYAKFLACF